MAHLLIDGYNLIGIYHRDPEEARKGLIRQLGRYRQKKGHTITLVFDGHGGGSAVETVRRELGIEVIFTRISKKADDLIKEIIRKKRSGVIVISSDREIADYAWGHGAVPVRSDDFLNRLEAALEEEAGYGGMDDEADEWEGRRKKGRRYTPSKREKAVRRALGKL